MAFSGNRAGKSQDSPASGVEALTTTASPKLPASRERLHVGWPSASRTTPLTCVYEQCGRTFRSSFASSLPVPISYGRTMLPRKGRSMVPMKGPAHRLASALARPRRRTRRKRSAQMEALWKRLLTRRMMTRMTTALPHRPERRARHVIDELHDGAAQGGGTGTWQSGQRTSPHYSSCICTYRR